MSAPAISAKGLRMRFGEVEALRGVDLEVTGPGVFGFLGKNGAGKSTTMQLLNGFFAPTGGDVRVFGEAVGPERIGPRRRVGYLQQQPAGYDWMTGLEELVFHGELMGLSRKRAREEATSLGAQLGIKDALKRKVGGYSGGMKQRLGLARALLGEPDLLLLDEPVSSLDPVGRAELLALVAKLGERAAVFMSTHILSDVERVADHVTVIHEGAIVLDEPLATLRRRYLRPLVELEVAPAKEAFVSAVREAAFAVRVETLPSLGESEQMGDREETRQRLLVEVTDAADAGRELPALVAAHGLSLLRLFPREPTLEETFLTLVKAPS